MTKFKYFYFYKSFFFYLTFYGFGLLFCVASFWLAFLEALPSSKASLIRSFYLSERLEDLHSFSLARIAWDLILGSDCIQLLIKIYSKDNTFETQFCGQMIRSISVFIKIHEKKVCCTDNESLYLTYFFSILCPDLIRNILVLSGYNYFFNYHHHHRTSLEDRPGGFFFLDTTKSWLQSDLFTAIFLISPASRDFSPDCRMCDEIWLRYVVFGAPGRRDDLILDS